MAAPKVPKPDSNRRRLKEPDIVTSPAARDPAVPIADI